MLKRLMLIVAAIAAPTLASAQTVVRVTVPEVRVRVAPPQPRVEIRPEPPSPRHQWTAGYWARRDNANVWVAGVWTLPPRDGMVWEDAHWTQRNGRTFYTEAHWRWQNEPSPTEVYEPPPVQEPVYIQHRPPENIIEVRPQRPFRQAVWIDGYWQWTGDHHAWVAGRWSAPRAGSMWTPDRWRRDDRRGHRGQWVLSRGHWRHR